MLNILVITPTASFGAFIQQVLEEDERYRPIIVSNSKQALEHISKGEHALAIIDANTKKQLRDTVKELRTKNPSIKIILIPPEDTDESDFSDLTPDGYLGKPFYVPAFMETIKTISAKDVTHPALPEETPPPWLQNVDRAAQHLTMLSLETAAQAALITKNSKIWAYAGQLSQLAVNELVQEITRYWDDNNKSDLARFIHLEATSAEYIIYATALSDHFILALAFEAEIPFSEVRAQAGKLARGLADIPMEEVVRRDSVLPTELPSWGGGTASPFANLFADLDLPPKNGTQETKPAPQLIAEEDKNAVLSPGKSIRVQEQDPPPNEEKEAQEQPSPPPLLEPPQEISKLRPISQGLHNLTYLYILIPRLPQHQLTGDIVSYLEKWMKRLCISFGWRLDYLLINPGYMQWEVAVSPKTPPYHLVKQLRQHTSRLIFEHFPNLAAENPSGEFWAQSHVIFSGKTVLPEFFIDDFIQKTRQEQGKMPQ
ncbi:MAG: hypothetical protein DRI56_00020 [Chloroflexota bacterium]|nr:MAG: hypothetical protein B6243_00625 [Anaerolineaceae bacterium 4572_5.2]RLD11883.1 MAG: hypothetical protein DRI56_00020 [Chloroflexota bacterium]